MKQSTAIGMFLALSVLLFGGATACGVNECADIAQQSGKETNYRVGSGCWVKLDTGWTPTKNWRTE